MADKDRFLPNLFILGAAKCGTTSLWEHLQSSREVCMSRPKEPLFFAWEFSAGLAHYRCKYFRHWKYETTIGDASHRNLYLPYVPERIHQTNPQAKLIVLLRNPIDRAYSHWWHFASRGRESHSFEEALKHNQQQLERGEQFRVESDYRQIRQHDVSGGNRGTYLDSGYYARQIERYRRLFPEQQIQIILFDQFVAKPFQTVSRLRSFLGLRGVNRWTFRLRRANRQQRRTPDWLRQLAPNTTFGSPIAAPASKILQAGLKIQARPKMQSATRAWLSEHYRPHNHQLAKELSLDLTHWD
ncbi:MAG: sulfotransferase [Pirellulaceae bacterium]|nr:sulfotransferase [Pirellulaceae bacterium]